MIDLTKKYTLDEVLVRSQQVAHAAEYVAKSHYRRWDKHMTITLWCVGVILAITFVVCEMITRGI